VSRTRKALIAGAAALSLLVASCSSSAPTAGGTSGPAGSGTGTSGESTPSTGAGSGSAVVVSLQDAVTVIDPHQLATRSSDAIKNALYDPLLAQKFTPNSDGLLVGSMTDFEPRAAKSYKVDKTAEGGMQITFTLRDDLKFPDGNAVTAEDYKYTFDRAIQGPGYVKSGLPFIGITSPDQIKVVDKSTLQITSAYNTQLVLTYLTFPIYGAMEQSVMEQHKTSDDPWAMKYLSTNDTGSGPFVVSQFDPDQQVTLKADGTYWNASKVGAPQVIVKSIPDPNQRALLLRSGAIDVAGGLPPSTIKQLEDDPNVKIYKRPTTGVMMMGLNQKSGDLANADLRKAIMFAVPYDELLSNVMQGLTVPAGGLVTSTMETHDKAIGAQYKTDIAQAEKYLQQSGLKDVHLKLSVQASDESQQNAAVLIQESLKKIGITLDIDQLSDAAMVQAESSKSLQMYLYGWYSWGEDPFYQMHFLATCDSPINYEQYCNPELDKLVDQGVKTGDAATRNELSSKAQQILFDDVPAVPLWSLARTVAAKSCITGIDRSNTAILGLASLTKPANCK